MARKALTWLSMPDVSVLMPVYNVSRYPVEWIRRALASVADAELCIGDDHSTDSTADLLHSLRPDIKVALHRWLFIRYQHRRHVPVPSVLGSGY